MDKKLKIVSIWEDPDVIELEISASNGLFSGATKCYSQRNEIHEIGNRLKNFQLKKGHEESISFFIDDKSSAFHFTVRCIDSIGSVNVKLRIIHIANYIGINPQAERYISEFDFNTEPILLENFAQELISLAKQNIGEVKAQLFAKI